jgi:predicted permease
LFYVLTAAALCLLLTACANVAGLELASAIGRARTYAVQHALGASRASLVRETLLEGAFVISVAIVAAAGLARVATEIAVPLLPRNLRLGSPAGIAVNGRSLVFMAAVAAVAWILASLPVVAYASRRSLVEVLKTETRSAAASRGSAIVRRTLTAGQVALAVLLLSGSLLAVRTFESMASVDKGFDTTGVGQIQVSLPVNADRDDVLRRLEEALRPLPFVQALTRGTAPPMFGTPFGNTIVEIDGAPAVSEGIRLSPWPVDRAYFDILGISPVRGRLFEPGEPDTSVIIPERFARRFFGDEDPIGHEVRWRDNQPWRTVVGVVPQMRTDTELLTGDSDDFWYVFPARQPPPPREPTAEVDTGGSWSMAMLLLRTDSETGGDAVVRAAERAVPDHAVQFAYVRDQYRDIFEPLEVAAGIVSAFGLLSFLVAAAGVYSVMAYLVASRRREMGIRLALGAAAADIRRLVLGSSVRLVAVGAAIGLGGTLAAATLARSLSPGVNPLDLATYVSILSLVAITALVATWHPARQASRVDPAVTLRGE